MLHLCGKAFVFTKDFLLCSKHRFTRLFSKRLEKWWLSILIEPKLSFLFLLFTVAIPVWFISNRSSLEAFTNNVFKVFSHGSNCLSGDHTLRSLLIRKFNVYFGRVFGDVWCAYHAYSIARLLFQPQKSFGLQVCFGAVCPPVLLVSRY